MDLSKGKDETDRIKDKKKCNVKTKFKTKGLKYVSHDVNNSAIQQFGVTKFN